MISTDCPARRMETKVILQENQENSSRRGSVASAKSGLGSEAGSLDERPVKDDVDLSIYEILERKAQCQTVIDILKDEEEFKVRLETDQFNYVAEIFLVNNTVTA